MLVGGDGRMRRGCRGGAQDQGRGHRREAEEVDGLALAEATAELDAADRAQSRTLLARIRKATS
nr:hypothetical protein OG999_01785 [Streptomyces sp. NBC_00886]